MNQYSFLSDPEGNRPFRVSTPDLDKFVMVPSSMRDHPVIGRNDIAVYYAMGTHANADRAAWPSLSTIARYLKCSESTVKRARRNLHDAGYITWSREHDPKRDRYYSHYVMHLRPQPRPDQEELPWS